MTSKLDNNSNSDLILYQTEDGQIRIDVKVDDETVWLTQTQIAALFERSVSTINEHINNVYDEGELDKASTLRKFGNPEFGINKPTHYYNLDVIISVGYRVKSPRGTQFRIWATKTLKEYIIKGFVLDDERLKQGSKFGKDYYDELLERIREIRSSERRFYQKITDIYAQCSIDYDPNSETTKNFYANVQNKLHWAITGHTAAELISERVDASKPNIGLSTWKNSPDGKILKSDVSIAKNYLSEKELGDLNLIVTMFLDFAELQARKQIPMKMQDWSIKLDGFLQFNEMAVLKDLGRISADIAKKLAEDEYEKYRIVQDEKYISDFDRATEKYLRGDEEGL
jgi:hypothetical protein